MSTNILAGKVCLITGATRGIGKGIALQLAEKGAKVYITGRNLEPPTDSKITGSLRETAQEIEARGGLCVPVQCDHSKDHDIELLFDQIQRENDGQLDVLVNNAFSAVTLIANAMNLSFWDLPTSVWDEVNNVALRNHYICSVYAARLMVPRQTGLIVNISSSHGLHNSFNVAFGVGKEACDRMAADCAVELQKDNVAFVSLWPGMVGTEQVFSLLKDNIENPKSDPDIHLPPSMRSPEKMMDFFKKVETPELSGQCIAAIVTDKDLMKMSGKILMTCDIARRYKLKDSEGHEPVDLRQVSLAGYQWLAWCIPDFVRMPKWIFYFAGYKFL